MSGITPRLSPSNSSSDQAYAINKTASEPNSPSSSSSELDFDSDCLGTSSSDIDLSSPLNSPRAHSDLSETRQTANGSPLITTSQDSAGLIPVANGTKADESPSSPVQQPKKYLASLVNKLTALVETQLDEMQKTIADGKVSDITFDRLDDIDGSIKLIKDSGSKLINQQKELMEKHANFTEIQKEIIKQVVEALSKLIEIKLNIMQTAVDAGKGAEISINATEELAADIRKLKLRTGKLQQGDEYFKRLETLADTINMAHINEATKLIVQPLLMGPEIELRERAASYSAGVVKNGLLSLDKSLLMRSIRGDGHCLFRCTLAHVLESRLSQSSEQRTAQIARLDATISQFNNASLNEKYAFFKKTLQTALETGCASRDIVCDEETSNKLVAFLRELVCTHNRQVENDVFTSFVLAAGKSKAEYLEDMISMQRAKYGDHPEIQALSTLLNLNICVIHVAEYGKSTDPTTQRQSLGHFCAHTGNIDLFLLFRPGHYDLAKPKNSQYAAQFEPVARGTRSFIQYALEKGWIEAKA